MTKTKKPRSAKQLANDERLRNARKKPAGTVDAPGESTTTAPELPPEDFVPTEVLDKQKKKEGEEALLEEPALPDNPEITDVKPDDNQPTHSPQTAPVDATLVATIVAAVIEAQRQNPQVAAAPPEAKLQELESLETRTSKTHAARLGGGGEVQGVVFRYEVDKGYYPDPTSRLLDEPSLARFAMRENFIFRWSVDGVEYKKNNIAYSEPRFTLELYRRLYDDEGQATGKAALVARQMAHEDEFTTRIMAIKLGILDEYDDTDEGFRALMNEIRYHRFKGWLFGIFTPPKVQTFRKRPLRQVIDGKVVEVYDTEELTDHDTGISQAATLSSQAGIGSVAVPGED